MTIQQPANTTKNYVALADVVRFLPSIAARGSHRLYNLASDTNTTHQEVASWLQRQGATVQFGTDIALSNCPTFQPIAIDRLAAEYSQPGDPFRNLSIHQFDRSNESSF